MMGRLEPLPCPFCGRVPDVRVVSDCYWVECFCGALHLQPSGGDYTCRYNAVRAWNKRAPVVQGDNTP